MIIDAGGSAASPVPAPPPAGSSDAGSWPADATGPPGPPGHSPHATPAIYAHSAATPPAARHLRHRAALADHGQDRLIPLLSQAHLPHATGVSRISRSNRQESAEPLSAISRRPD